MSKNRGSITWLIALTLANVLLQVAAAALIKLATLAAGVTLATAGILAVVLALNFGRFVLWNSIHKRYDLSVAYPASALFFPCIVAVSYLFGERVEAHQIGGAALVTAGVAVLMIQAKRQLHEARTLEP